MFSDEERRDRYQRASNHFCQTQLDLPTPDNPNPVPKVKPQSWSSTSSSNSSFVLNQTRSTRHSKTRISRIRKQSSSSVGCQTRLSLPPTTDLESLIQSFASNSDQDEPLVTVSNTSLNGSLIRRKLFSDEDDLLDETPLVAPPRRSSIFDVN